MIFIKIILIEHPQQRVDFKFTKDCVFVSFEVTGKSEVDLIGYVIGLDTSNILPLKEAMELSDRSDDEDYKEEGSEEEEEEEKEEDNEEEKEEEEEEEDEIDSENDSEYEKMMVSEEEKMMEENDDDDDDEDDDEKPRDAIDENAPVFNLFY